MMDETSYPIGLSASPTISQPALDRTPYDEDQDSLSDSSELAEAPPTWASFRFTHLLILIPLSIITLFALAIPPVCQWFIDGLDERYPFFETLFLPFAMGCVGFLACFGLKKSISDGLIQLLSRRKHDPTLGSHRHRIAFDLALCLVLQVVLVELLRFTVLINQRDPLPRHLPTHLIQADLSRYSDRPQFRETLDVQFFVAFAVGLGWSFLELLVLGGSEWIQQVLLYKRVLLDKENADVKIECGQVVYSAHEDEPHHLESRPHIIDEAVSVPANHSIVIPDSSAINFVCRSSHSHSHDYHSLLNVHELDEQSRPRSADSIQTPGLASFSMASASPITKPGTRIKTNIQIGEGTYCVTRATQATESGSNWCFENEAVAEVEICRIAMESLERRSVENAIGLALWQIPWFIVWVWRLNSSLLTLALSLLIARGVFPNRGATTAMGPAGCLALAVIVKSVMVMLWSFKMKTIGLILLTYITLLICLGSFFSSLSLWGLLI